MKSLILIGFLLFSTVIHNSQIVESNPSKVQQNIIQLTPAGYISLPLNYWAYMKSDFMDAWAGSIETLDGSFVINYTDGTIVSIFEKEKPNFKWQKELKTDDYTITYALSDNGKIKQAIAKIKTANFSTQIQDESDIDRFLEIISKYKTGRCESCFSSYNSKQLKRFFEKRLARVSSNFIFTCSNLQPLLESEFKTWINEEVKYLIFNEEKKIFNKLTSKEDKLTFINNFWLRRDLDPDTEENEYKTEYCDRVNQTNRFQSGILGWKTDRGLVFILYGQPDQIERGNKDFDGFPKSLFEKWSYKNLDNGNEHNEYIFIDPTETNEFRLTNVTRDKLLKHLN